MSQQTGLDPPAAELRTLPLLDRGEVAAYDDRQMMIRAVDPLEDRQGPPDLLPPSGSP